MGVFEDVIKKSSRRPEGIGGVIERRKTKRTPMLRSSSTNLTSHQWDLELVPAFGLNRLSDQIAELATRSVDQNIFFEPTVIMAAWPRLTSLLAPDACWMLTLWETIGDKRQMRLFMPVRLNNVGFPRHQVLQVLSNEYMPVGTPLLDKECADEACETLLRLLSDPALDLPATLDMTHQTCSSKTYGHLKQAAKNLGLQATETGTYERAALFNNSNAEDKMKTVLRPKSRRELRRQLRKLEENNKIEFLASETEEQALDAFERFITLELKSWKGRRGTALYNHKKITAFSRQIVASLASEKTCDVHTLMCNGSAIGAVIMLGKNGRMVPWKMAFDEDFSAHSPGMQVMMKATEALLNDPNFIEADSLAIPSHWMMNRIWPDRLEITNLVVSLKPANDELASKTVASKERLDSLKRWVKKMINYRSR
jgi:hypothetical protein